MARLLLKNYIEVLYIEKIMNNIWIEIVIIEPSENK